MKATTIIPILFFVLMLPSLANAEKIIIINETDEHVYALEDLTLAGDLSTNALSLYGSGKVIAGKNVRVYLIGPVEDVLVKDLTVNGNPTAVSFDDRGYFFVASEGDFKLAGTVDVRTIGQLRLKVPGPLNHLHFDLVKGYAVGGDRFGLFNDEIVVQRTEEVAMLVEGAFKYTFAKLDEFYYQISFSSFGSTLGGYTISLPNGETVNSVSGALKWEQAGDKLTLELSGDKASVIVNGQFKSRSLRVPLSEGKHNVVIESDPEKKITIETSAKELDVSESQIPPTYANARAFLASPSDYFTIKIKDLGLLPSLAASVSNARNQIAVTQDGSIVGEVSYNYANTGVDYLPLEVPGTPLYASTSNEAVKLTKEDKLFLALPKTNYGSLDVVYFETRGRLKPFDVIKVPTAKTDLPISQASTSVFLPKSVFVLETLGAEGGSELPSVESALIFIVIVGAVGLLVKKTPRFALSYVILSVGALALDARIFLLLQAAAVAVYVKRKLAETKSGKYLVVAVGVVLVLGVLLIVFAGLVSQLGVFSATSRASGAYNYYAEDTLMQKEAPAPQFSAMQRVGEGAGAITVPTREGVLPVKLQIPRMGKSITVTNYLVTKEKPVELTLIVCASWLKYLLYLAAVLAATECAKTAKET